MKQEIRKLPVSFFRRQAVEVAPDLVGKLLICDGGSGRVILRVTETEVYQGEEDTACHASSGRTRRNAPLYEAGGLYYVYLCYGMHWMLNVVTGDAGDPQGVLFRACAEAPGPGRLTKALGADGRLRGLTVENAPLWIGDDGYRPELKRAPRVGIGYADRDDRERLWRFIDAAEKQKMTGSDRK